ncbi:myb-like protein X [Diorhabda sublineata]|uniref:myb-like protein X n=1 Tax=Diorhabda sublineata TaxID=1163346 RepID=UPI0024E0B09D|nr:myb-like protein X [Diorhabda sublineata]
MAEVLKKHRKSNFSQDEIEVLMKTVGNHYETLYGEFSKKAINKIARHRAWLEVTKEVNSVSMEKRTLQEVKNKWKKCQHLYHPDDFIGVKYYEDEVLDVTNVWEPLTELDDEDSMPLEQRLKAPTTAATVLTAPPEAPVSEQLLQSQPLSPTKLKVTRQLKPSAPSPILPPPAIEEVCLKWNSHHSNMQHTFPNLLLREQYVDATLVADGQTLKCHRVILSSCSPYFEEVLASISPYQHPVLFMKDIPFWILKCLCDFMYSGEVHILQNKLEELLAVAEMLKIKGLAGQRDMNMIDTKPEFIVPIKEEKIDEKEKELRKKEDREFKRKEEKEVKKKEEKEIKKKEEKEVKKREEKEVKKKEEKDIKKKEEKEMKKKEEKEIKKKDEMKISEIKPLKKREEKDLTRKEEKQTKKKEETKEIKEKKRVTIIPSPEKPLVKSSKVPKVVIQNPLPILKNKQKTFVESKKRDKRLEKEKLPVIEKIPITKDTPSTSDFSNPFGLLKPVYEEVTKDPKPNKLPVTRDPKNVNVKRTLQKKLKKRKLTDDREESPPPALSRKGTRSRPRSKVAKYFHPASDLSYDESTIVREPHTDQADSFVQIQDIKSEPLYDDSIEIEDNLVGFSESSVSVEEQLIGCYDSSFDNFGRRITRRSKPIIMDVQSITHKPEEQHTLKIVNVAELKAIKDPLEDPLGLNQSSSDSTTMVDQTDNSLGFHISEVVTEKDDSQSSDVCREMGFKITNVVSEQEEDRKMEQLTTEIEASYEEEQEFNEFDETASQNEDQKPILTLIETEDSNSNPLGKQMIQLLLVGNEATEATTSMSHSQDNTIQNKMDTSEDDELISCPANFSFKIKEELLTENEQNINKIEEEDIQPMTQQITLIQESRQLETDQVVQETLTVTSSYNTLQTIANEEKFDHENEQTPTISIIPEAHFSDEIDTDTDKNYVETEPIQMQSTSSNINQAIDTDELNKTYSVDEKPIISISYSSLHKDYTLDDSKMDQIYHFEDSSKVSDDKNNQNDIDDYQMEAQFAPQSGNIPIDHQNISENNPENMDHEMSEGFDNLGRNLTSKPNSDEIQPMNEYYGEENNCYSESADNSSTDCQVTGEILDPKDQYLIKKSNTLDMLQIQPLLKDQNNLATLVENDSMYQQTINISQKTDFVDQNSSQIENIALVSCINNKASFDISNTENEVQSDYRREEESSETIHTDEYSSIYNEESSSNVPQREILPSRVENQTMNNRFEKSSYDILSHVVSYEENQPVCIQENNSSTTKTAIVLSDSIQPVGNSFTENSSALSHIVSYDENQPVCIQESTSYGPPLSDEIHTISFERNSEVAAGASDEKHFTTNNLEDHRQDKNNFDRHNTSDPHLIESSCDESQLRDDIESSSNVPKIPKLSYNENELVYQDSSFNTQLQLPNDESELMNKFVGVHSTQSQNNLIESQPMETDHNELMSQTDENHYKDSNSQLLQHNKQSYNPEEKYNTTEHVLINSLSEVDCDINNRSEEIPSTPFSLCENVQPLDFNQKETILPQQIPENSAGPNKSNLLETDLDNSHVPYERCGNVSSSNVQAESVPVVSETDRDHKSRAVDFPLGTEEMSSSNEPGFHIAQVISEQIAEIEGSRVNEQFVSDTSSVNKCENKVSNSNELESIVDDLSKIVEGSCEESSIADDTNSIADSLENLLQKKSMETNIFTSTIRIVICA